MHGEGSYAWFCANLVWKLPPKASSIFSREKNVTMPAQWVLLGTPSIHYLRQKSPANLKTNNNLGKLRVAKYLKWSHLRMFCTGQPLAHVLRPARNALHCESIWKFDPSEWQFKTLNNAPSSPDPEIAAKRDLKIETLEQQVPTRNLFLISATTKTVTRRASLDETTRVHQYHYH